MIAGALVSLAAAVAPPFAQEDGASFDLSATVTTDSSWPLAGGVRQRRTDRALVEVTVGADLGDVLGSGRTSASAQFYTLSGRNGSDDVGDIQVYSNIDEDHVTQLAELWFQHETPSRRFRFKAGKFDANSEYAVVEAGGRFLQSSAGFSPTVFPFPSYPDPAMGLHASVAPTPSWQVSTAVFNADEDGATSGRRGLTAEFDEAFFVAQVDRRWSQWGALGPGRCAVGAWHHTGRFSRFGGNAQDGAEGPYAVFEQTIAEESPGTWTAFLQLATADENVSEIDRHLAAGVFHDGPLFHLEEGRTGLYVSQVSLSDVPAAGLGGEELVVELFQEFPIFGGLVARPDLQWIVDPSGDEDVDDVWVFTLRLELAL